jgi:pyruvate dehydrogenase E2 component (dihydrolipoamide acetyltransferase)
MEGIKIKETIHQPVARRFMAKAMLACWNSVPHFVQMSNANADNLIRAKQETGRTFNDILIKCLINAVKKNPNVNSTLEGDDWIIYEDINVSVAMISEHGLFVPVIRNAGDMNVDELSEAVQVLAEKARKGTLMPDEQALGTITISNLGATGVETGFPIINTPQGALAFIGNIRKVPIVDDDDKIVVGHEIGYGIAYDHRFIDGMIGQAFTTGFKEEIEGVTKEKLY